MSLQSQLAGLITSIGLDMKNLLESIVYPGNHGDIFVSGTYDDYWEINNNAVVTSKINNKAVTVSKIQNLANNRLLGNVIGYDESPAALSAAQVKTMLALSDVDNTSDASKPVSTAQAAAIGAKATTGAVVSFSDITTSRTAAPATGYLYFGNAGNRYIGWDGTNLVASPAGTPYAIHHTGNFDPATKLGVAAKAADSTLLDGTGKGAFVYGSTANKTAQYGDDWNAAMPSGFYESSTSVNAPVGGFNWALNVRHSNVGNHYGFQLANPIGSGDLYLRGIDSGVPTSWNKLWHSGNFNPVAQPAQTIAGGPVLTSEGGNLRIEGTLRTFTPVICLNANSTGWLSQPRIFVGGTPDAAQMGLNDLWVT